MLTDSLFLWLASRSDGYVGGKQQGMGIEQVAQLTALSKSEIEQLR
jgi:hypothetical protein